METWKVQTPAANTAGEGRLRPGQPDLAKLNEIVARMRTLHHPALVGDRSRPRRPGRLVLLSDVVKETVRDRYQKCQAHKMPGIPRGELVDYLRATAEVSITSSSSTACSIWA